MSNNSTVGVTSAFDLFAKSYEVVMRNIKNFALLLAFPAIGAISSTINYNKTIKTSGRWTHINFFGTSMPAYSIVGLVSVGIILFALFCVAALIIQAMLTGLELEGAQGKTPSLSALWEVGKKYWLRLFGLFLVVGLYLLASIIPAAIIFAIFRNWLGMVLGGTVLVISVLFVLMHYFLAPYAMIDKDLPVFSAMEYSAKISKKHAGSIFSVLGVITLLSLTGVIPFIGAIISFGLGALYSVAPALRYQELKKLS